jgi:hypothetical protein
MSSGLGHGSASFRSAAWLTAGCLDCAVMAAADAITTAATTHARRMAGLIGRDYTPFIFPPQSRSTLELTGGCMDSNRWWQVVGVAVIGLVLAVAAYNVGLSDGAARAAASAGGAPVFDYGWGWHRHWGFGFPLFFIFFWLLIVRGLFWGGPWRRRWHYYYDDPPRRYDDGLPRGFEEMHRRAHERMNDNKA